MKTLEEKMAYSEELVAKINYDLKKIRRQQTEGGFSKMTCRSTMDDICSLQKHFREMIDSMKVTE